MNVPLNGLFMQLPDQCGHTYGIWAINNPQLYDALRYIFFSHPMKGKWFLQSDSNHTGNGDKSAIFIEFLGQGLNDDSALQQCENIASSIGTQLQIL